MWVWKAKRIGKKLQDFLFFKGRDSETSQSMVWQLQV